MLIMFQFLTYKMVTQLPILQQVIKLTFMFYTHKTKIQKVLQKLYHSYKVQLPVLVTQSYQTLQPHKLQPARLLHPWISPGEKTGVDCLSLLLKYSYPIIKMNSLISPNSPQSFYKSQQRQGLRKPLVINKRNTQADPFPVLFISLVLFFSYFLV